MSLCEPGEMTLDIPSLVAPLSEESPAGPDLSYHVERLEIEAAFEKSVSIDTDGDESPTDWLSIIALIVSQAERTRDLWLPVYLMRAAAHAKRFEVLVGGSELLAGLVEGLWPVVHPQLDEVGFIGRKALCESLTRIGDFLGPLNRVPLLEHPRLGRFSCADLIRFNKQGSGAEGFGMFRSLIEATPDVDLAVRLTQVESLQTALRRLDAVMSANAEGDTAPNFKPTHDLIEAIRGALARFVPGIGPPSEPIGAGDGGTGPIHGEPTMLRATSGRGETFSGAVATREDVVLALDAICRYYAVHEPGSPVPLALGRARAWIGLDFMAVLQDIAPGSVDEAGLVLRGARGEPEEPALWEGPTSEETPDATW